MFLYRLAEKGSSSRLETDKAKPSVRVGRKAAGLLGEKYSKAFEYAIKADSRVAEVNGRFGFFLGIDELTIS